MRTATLIALVTISSACGTGVSAYKNPMPSPMVSPTLAQGENPCGLYLDPSGKTGAYQSHRSLDLFGTAPLIQADANARTFDAAGRFMERCSNGSARVIMAHGFAKAWKRPFSSNPVWQKIGLGMNAASDKEAERERVKKVYDLYLKNVAKIKGGKSGAPAETPPETSEATPSIAPSAPQAVDISVSVANAKSFGEIAGILSAEAQKGGPKASMYKGLADSFATMPSNANLDEEKSKLNKAIAP